MFSQRRRRVAGSRSSSKKFQLTITRRKPHFHGVLSFNPSMYERHTFWNVMIGGFTYWTSYNSVNQTMVQRYMSLPDLRQAKQ